jgi:hypothetical protein
MDKQINNVNKNQEQKISYTDTDCKVIYCNTLLIDPDEDKELERELRREDRKRYEETGNWWYK